MGDDAALKRVWNHARDVVGLLGPGPVERHLEHAEGFLAHVPAEARSLLDLGSGAGVPGLLIAIRRPDITVTLLDGSSKRCDFLHWAVQELGLASEVVQSRAEDAGRDPNLRESFDVVTSRSFASPAVTAECATPFIRVGGHLVVSEPPTSTGRWPDTIPELSLALESVADFAVFAKVGILDERFPRRNGIPAKRPLF